ncbi:MAG: alpha/beta fold hydrolase, partial [Patescibacteria group bacterium]|nr:alpha/beta fold hydrolase [Patescibacteria group bacterium]
PPTEYETVSSYASVVVPFAESGYIVLKPDYRGNGNSEGTPTQVYVSEGYVTDSMNAIASIKKYKDANPQKIGIWGHSMGGNVTLHELVIPVSVQAVDIWSGVVGTYTNILSWWDNRVATGVLTTQNDLQTLQLVRQFTKTHGTPDTNPQFWQAIDPTDYLSKVQSPVLIQVGTGDTVVPPDFSSTLYASLKQLGKNVQFVSYPGADHNLAPDSTSAMGAAIAFFNTFLK